MFFYKDTNYFFCIYLYFTGYIIQYGARAAGRDLQEEVYGCPNANCHRVFKWRSNLTKHINFECGKPPRFMCSKCYYRSPRKHDVMKHTTKQHPNETVTLVELYKPDKARGEFKCPNINCGSTFKKQYSLTYHLKHFCDKPPRFKCPYCFHVGKLSTNIKQHIRCIHPGKSVCVIQQY